MRRITVGAFLILLAATAGAQEFDIFEVSDFFDPRLRGAKYSDEGLRIIDEGTPFLVNRASIGAISDYYWRAAPSGADVGVFHDVTSFYWGANQLNLKLTHLRTRDDEALLPRNRGVVQYARYVARKAPKELANAEEIPVLITRYLVGLAVEENPDALEDLEGHRALNYELAAEVDVRVPFTEVLGTISYVKRFAGAGHSTQRFAYVLHTAQHEYRRVNFDMNVAIGAQKTSTWRWGDVRPSLHVRLPVDKVGTVIHVAYAPTLSFEGGFDARHEVALFLDRALFAKKF